MGYADQCAVHPASANSAAKSVRARGLRIFLSRLLVHQENAVYNRVRMEMYPMKCFTLLTVIFSACVATPDVAEHSYPTPRTKEDCMQLFVDILEKQGQRTYHMSSLESDREKLEKGKMSVKKFRKRAHRWRKIEARLQREVTYMYDVGYESGCFNKVEENDSTQ